MSINDKFLIRGERLKLERKRLKLTQPAIADLLNVAVGSVVRYEKQGDPLNQNQLMALQDAGFDTIYITYGRRVADLSDDEYEVVEAYRCIADETKAGFIAMCKAYASANMKR